MDAFSRFWRAISFARSDTDCQSAQECLKRSLACIDSIERCTGSLHFNHSLCERFVTKYVSRSRELLDAWQSEIELYREQCTPALTALHKTLNEAEFLMQKHCASSHWLWAAVELVENTSAFAEVILDLRWYTHALQIAIELSRGTSPRQSRQQKQEDLLWKLQKDAMKEHGDFLEGWERECKQLRLHGDREALLSKLKVGSGASLDSYLAQKLGLSHMHAREALAVNLNVTELLHGKHLLGKGNYGKVYKVQWLGMPCALKQLNAYDVDEVVPEEVKILSKLHHPNIIQLYGYYFERGSLYLIMELMDDSLSEYVIAAEWIALQSSPKDFLLVALDCMLQIAKGLRYLHSQGMAHRDLKGDNVLVKPSENPDRRSKGYLSVKLTDFGLAKANLRNSTYSSLDWKAGSLSWKAPELLRVGNNVDRPNVTPRRKNHPLKPDVYSFAVVCAEILCGTQPFPNAELQPRLEFCYKVKGGKLRPKLPEKILPPELADYIKRCWDTDPVNRPEFRDICKRIRHFRDSLLEVNAFVGWELEPQPERGPVIQEPSAIDEDDFIDIPEGEWTIEYDDISHKERIHSGSGFLQVYLAQLNSECVLAKHIEPLTLVRNEDLNSSFKHEVKSLVRIRHPNLVYYLGATRRPPYVVVTEFAQGVTLRKFLNKTAPLSQPDAVRLALQVALGMARLHEDELSIIHGELSPDCILVDENTMTAKVLDFGLRRFRNEPDRHYFPRFFRRAPEQHLGLPLHTSVDVFAFGMILYDLLEYEKAQLFWNKKKSKKKTASEKLQAGERPVLGSPESYPEGVHALVKRCWTHNWQERPDFDSVVSVLRKVDTDLRSNLLRSTSIVRTNSKDKRRV